MSRSGEATLPKVAMSPRETNPSWVRTVMEVGFPILAFMLVWQFMVTKLDRLSDSIDRNTNAIVRLMCKMDPPSCDNSIQRK